MSEDWRSAWTSALDELELDVAAAEAMLADGHRYAEHVLDTNPVGDHEQRSADQSRDRV